MPKIKVLLADDHPIFRDGARAILEKEADIELVGEATNGQEAIEQSTELLPDVIVMDIGMPKVNGLQAATTIKEIHPEIGILILTRYDDDEYAYNLLKQGVTGYLLKRNTGKELTSAIRTIYRGELLVSSTLAKRLVGEYLKPPAEKKRLSGLTDREFEITKLIAQGYKNKEIAEKLFTSIKTVETHRTHIYKKLDIHDRTELVKLALDKGLLDKD